MASTIMTAEEMAEQDMIRGRPGDSLPVGPDKTLVTLDPEVMELLRSIASDLEYLAMRRDLG